MQEWQLNMCHWFLKVVSFVCQQLDKCGINIPPYALVNREYPDQELDYFVEEEDYVEVHGKRIMKPFVEKPVDGMLVLIAKYGMEILHHDCKELHKGLHGHRCW